MFRRLALTGLAFVLAACVRAPSAAISPDRGPYDVLITNGRVVDGSGNPWFYGDVALRRGRVVRVARAGVLVGARATTRVDARGLVVAPGFIDIQSHSWDALLWADGRVVSKVTQGVTTEILGEATTPAPSNARVVEVLNLAPADSVQRRLQPSFEGAHGFRAWLGAMDHHPKSVNAGSYLGAATVRAYVKGQTEGAPTPAELDTMRAIVRRAMEDGAFGISSALIYPPGSYATTGELIEMAKAMAPYHGSYITHMRSEDDSLLEAMDEALRIGHEAAVPVDIYHLKASGKRNWGKAGAMVAKIDSARAAGQDVGATMYPYPASGNNLASCVPDWAFEGGKLLANLKDGPTRQRIVREMTDTTRGSRQYCQGDGPSVIMVVGFRKAELKKYEGLRLNQIADSLHTDWADALVDLTLAEEGRLSKLTFGMSEENIAMQLRRPWVVIGSDAGGVDPDSATALTHPRAYGTFTRVLGKYVRDDGVLTLEDAVRKMTSATALRLGLRDRGLLREGMYADVVIFDPGTVADRATYDRPHQLSVGVRDVFVNGVAVVRDGKHTGATPGRVVRGPGWTGER
jgi:N-acyl-D-amino-acid deacylase